MAIGLFKRSGLYVRTALTVSALVAGAMLVGSAQATPERATAGAQAQGSVMSAGVQVQNLSGTAANATATYYNKDGSTAATQNFIVPANGSYTLFGATMSAPAGFSGSAVISADQPVVAITNILGSGPTVGDAYDGVSTPATTVNIPLFQQGNGGYNSSLYVQDTSGAANNVTVKFNSGGATVSTQNFALSANGSITVDATNDGLSGTFVGSAIVTGTGGVAAVVTQSNGSILFSYGGSPQTSTTLNAPLLMTGNHGWGTGLQVLNTGSQSTTVSLTLNGSQSPVASAPLAPGQSVTWYPIPGTSNGFVGSGTVTSTNGAPLLGVVNELNANTGQGMSYVTVGGGTQTVNMPLIMYGNSGYFTGEQVQNVGTIAATVDLKVNGTTVDTQVIQPGQSYTWFGSDLLNGTKVGSAAAVARENGAQIVGIVNEITSPQVVGDTSFSYNGFNQ